MGNRTGAADWTFTLQQPLVQLQPHLILVLTFNTLHCLCQQYFRSNSKRTCEIGREMPLLFPHVAGDCLPLSFRGIVPGLARYKLWEWFYALWNSSS